MRSEVAHRRIESFGKRFGEAHLYLAYHAAFPLALTPDLLYRLWANFQRDIHGQVIGIPWIAVADLLLSSLCDEVGHELYEMDAAVRNVLLSRLKEDENFGQQRINELSAFLLDYVQQQLHSDDPDIQDFAQAQQWTALAYTQPGKAARELALSFSKLNYSDKAELIRMASLTETLAEPLSKEFKPLLVYARGMANFARGAIEAAATQLQEVLEVGNIIGVAGISLPIPEPIKLKFPPVSTSSRKTRLLILGGITAVLFIVILGIYTFRFLGPSVGQVFLMKLYLTLPSSNDLPSRILKYMEARGYQIDAGKNRYNIVYVEGMNADGTLNDDRPNYFNDRRMVIEVINGIPTIVGNWEASTEPGNYYTENPMNPQGAARIKFGQYKAWRVGTHYGGGSDPHEALVQEKPVTVYRDFNKDHFRIGDKMDTGLFDINQNWGYDLPYNNVYFASAGNLVGRTRQGHREFMSLIKQDERYVKNKDYLFITTIIDGNDLGKMFPDSSARVLQKPLNPSPSQTSSLNSSTIPLKQLKPINSLRIALLLAPIQSRGD
jgi:hypothetical protein